MSSNPGIPQRVALVIDGHAEPVLSASLLRWELTEAPQCRVSGTLEIGVSDFSQRADEGNFKPSLGATVEMLWGSEQLFTGVVAGLTGKASGVGSPSVVLRVDGTRSPAPAGIARTLLVGAEVERAELCCETDAATSQLIAGANGDVAVGPDGLRPGSVAVIRGVGEVFDGPFQIQQVHLRFDGERGMHAVLHGSGITPDDA